MTRQEQKEARRKEILMRALELFVKKGYHETKISDIAESAQMSVGLLFHYFESKEELYIELVKMGVEGTRHPEKLKNLPPEQFFETFLNQLFSYAKEQPWVFQMFVLMGQAEKEGLPQEARTLSASINQIAFSAEIIKKGQQEGVFREGNPLLLSTCFWASVQGVMEQMAVAGDFIPDAKWLVAILKK